MRTMADATTKSAHGFTEFVRSARVLMSEASRRIERQASLSLEQFEVLNALCDSSDGRLRMSDLASATQLSRSGMTRMVDRLEKSGLVIRESCPDDRRCMFCRLTKEGRKAHDEAWPVMRDAIRSLFEQPAGEDLDCLRDASTRIREAAATA